MNRRGFFKTLAVAALSVVGLGKLADWMALPCNHLRHIGPSTITIEKHYDCMIHHWTPEMEARYKDWFAPRKDGHA